jgi:hypothetical protein
MKIEDIVVDGYYLFGNSITYSVRLVTAIDKFFVDYNVYDNEGNFLSRKTNIIKEDFSKYALKRVKPIKGKYPKYSWVRYAKA